MTENFKINFNVSMKLIGCSSSCSGNVDSGNLFMFVTHHLICFSRVFLIQLSTD